MSKKMLLSLFLFMATVQFVKAQPCGYCDSCPVYKATIINNNYMGLLKVEKVSFKQDKENIDLSITLSNSSEDNIPNLVLRLKYYDKKGKLLLIKKTYTYEYLLAKTKSKTINLKRTPEFYVPGLTTAKSDTIGRIDVEFVSGVFIDVYYNMDEYRDIDELPHTEE